MGFNVAEATNAWCILWKRGELFLDFAGRLVFLRTPTVDKLLFCLLLVCGFACEDDDDWAEAVGSVVCPWTTGHTTAVRSSAKEKYLRNPTTSLFYYRRKLLPRRETSSSARLRINS